MRKVKMTSPYYYDEKTRDQRRDWIRGFLPTGRDGFVFEDLDGIVRVYNENDPIGRFILVEFTWNAASMSNAQNWTFRLLDGLLRDSKTFCERYLGFYCVNWPGDFVGDRYIINFQTRPLINGVEVSWNELRSFFLFEHRIDPIEFAPLNARR